MCLAKVVTQWFFNPCFPPFFLYGPSEGEAEAEWLQDAGLSDLIGDGVEENGNIVLLSTLTKTQAAAVQRRLDTYTRSRRKKNKQPVRDVRDIFGVVSSGVRSFIFVP